MKRTDAISSLSGFAKKPGFLGKNQLKALIDQTYDHF
jgi:hypothetical protein